MNLLIRLVMGFAIFVITCVAGSMVVSVLDRQPTPAPTPTPTSTPPPEMVIALANAEAEKARVSQMELALQVERERTRQTMTEQFNMTQRTVVEQESETERVVVRETTKRIEHLSTLVAVAGPLTVVVLVLLGFVGLMVLSVKR